MARVVSPLGEEYEAERVLVRRIATVMIETVVVLGDEVWDEEDDIGEEVNDVVSRGLKAADAVPGLYMEVLSVDNETVEVIDG